MSNEDEEKVDRLIESAYMRENRREVTAEDDVRELLDRLYWLRIEAQDAQTTSRDRWSEIVRLRHDRKIMLWTIMVLVVSNLVAWRPWEWTWKLWLHGI